MKQTSMKGLLLKTPCPNLPEHCHSAIAMLMALVMP